MERTKAERALIGLLLLGVVFLAGLFVGRSLRSDGVLQLPDPAPRPAVTVAITADDGLLDLNTATASELEALPGIGPTIAGRIVAYREEKGPFVSTEELLLVRGIGEKLLQTLEPYVTVTATDE